MNQSTKTAGLRPHQTYARTILTASLFACTLLAGCIDGSIVDSLPAQADTPSEQVRSTPNVPLAAAFPISVSVTGQAGSGLVLQNNGGDDLAVAADGSFTFATLVANGAPFAVTVSAQPTNPAQLCTVNNGTGAVADAPVTDVSVVCSTNTHTVGGSVSGLTGNGLVLRNNGADDLAVAVNGTFTFATPVADGAAFAVTVSAQPANPAQVCTVNNSAGAGAVAGAPVTGVSVVCSTISHTVGGSVSGLNGNGLVLQNNVGDDLPVAANGTFTFATPVADGAAFAVTVRAQPVNPAQVCTVNNGAGTVAGAPVTSVSVVCSTIRHTVGGSVSGLNGSGLVLRNNGGDDLAIGANGSFTFATTVADGAAFAVTVSTQPTNPAQVCTVSNGAGTVAGAPVTGVSVVCSTNRHTVGGSVSGKAGSGLVLRNNGGDDLAVAANGSFTFATTVADGAPFAVTVSTQPTNPAQVCTVNNGTGTVAGAPVTSVSVVCSTSSHTVGGSISGQAGSGLVLRNNGGDDLAIGANDTFTFATPVANGAPFSVTVSTQPTNPAQVCTVNNGAGTVAGAPVTSVSVVCSTVSHTVGGSVSGLNGSGLVLRNNGGDDRAVAVNGTFTFAAKVADGADYAVTVSVQPVNPAQVCTVSNGTGVIAGAPVTSVSVVCSTSSHTIGGSVSGLNGSGLVLQNNGGDDLTVEANGTFTFAARVANGASYAATVKTQPSAIPAQTCTVTNGSGTVTSAAVTGITVNCAVPTPRFAYVANRDSNSISIYKVNATTGALAPPSAAEGPPSVPLPLGSSGPQSVAIATTPGGGTFVYVANNGSNDVAAYKVDTETGALSPVTGSPFRADVEPFAVTVAPDGKTVYVANNASNTVSIYTINTSSGKLTPISGSPFGEGMGTNPRSVTVSPGGKFAYVANAISSNISVYEIIPPNGKLKPVAGSPFPIGASVGAGARPNSVEITPDGKFAHVSNVGTNNVSTYTIDAVSGVPTPVAGPFFSTGTNPRALAIAPDGQFAYVANAASNDVSAYKVDGMTAVPGSAFGALAGTGTNPRSVIVAPGGKFVYVTNFVSNNVSAYTINTSNGALVRVTGSPFGAGSAPTSIAVLGW